MKKADGRKRANTVQKALNGIENDSQHHLAGSFKAQTPNSSANSTPTGSQFKHRPDDFYDSKGMWIDIKELRWMRVPSSSFKLLMIPLTMYTVCAALGVQSNPFTPMLFISYHLPDSSPDDPRCGKGWLDLAFIAYHIVVFSFIRIKKNKLDRFGEQAYAVLYYGAMGAWGTYIMSKLPTWWYQTQYYWIDYPHWRMLPALKRYYLMHLSYWIQQLVVLALRIEKPRKDFKELVAHHIVTLWLIGWSYGVNMTLIGNAVFVSMDIPDVFLGLSKLFNYLGLEKLKIVSFVMLFATWTYFRHWLNLVILHSVWTEFDLIRDELKFFQPWKGLWMAWWMKYQMFLPILLLQFLNLFWYFLLVRIAYRALVDQGIDDDRSDDEDDEDEVNLKED